MKKFLLTTTALLSLTTPAFADDMPINRVILSTSGLAQFEHKANITGNQTLDFSVRLDQVDDILKSLVIFDAKGRLGAITLPGQQPLEQIFKDLPFNRSQLTSAMMLLNAYQGAVLTVKAGTNEITGKILQVTPETTINDNNKSTTKHRISLMTDSGMKQALLEDASSIQFADSKIRADIAKALDAIRASGALDKRTLTVNLLGSDKRDVTLSYVVAAPVWKTAYRMVVPTADKTSGFLQGFAVVENMTAADWNNIDLSLVSGTPVTFKQGLYSSYTPTRQEVPVEVFGLKLPRADQGVVADAATTDNKDSRHDAKAKMLAAPAPMMAADGMAMNGMMAESMATGIDSISGGANIATSSDAKTQVLFHFPDRVTLKSGQSMLIPFISTAVPMQRVSLYQPDTNAQHPLAAVEVTNTGKSALPSGIVTLYEENTEIKATPFSGDAQLSSIAAGEKKFISYALDSKTTIDRQDEAQSTEDQITIASGIMKVSVKNILTTNYTIKAPMAEDRLVVLEHRRMGADYKLVDPDPSLVDVTDQYYRIKAAVKAGAVNSVKVVLENQQWQSYQLDTMPTDQLMLYIGGRGNLNDAQKAQFKELADMRRAIDALDQKIMQIDQQREMIFQDQARVRENLKSLGVESAVQKKYLDKLNAQEDDVAKLDAEKKVLNAERQEKFTTLQAKIAGLNF